jgi:glycosyltransferase involved in cell wall biosynthesis
MSPTLSIVIACRNAADTLGVQLEALAAQSRHIAWDVVLCDNGSTDGTLEVAESYRSRLPALRIVPATERSGPAYARNVGAATSDARWLAFVDADDEVAPGWLDAMAAALTVHPFVAGRFEAGRLNSEAVLRSRPLQQDSGLQHSTIGPGLPHAGAGNMGIHRAVFEAVGGFDVDLGCLEDTDFCWRVQLSGVPLVFAADAAVHVRLRSSFRRMWLQGKAYGAATAELEHRYGRVAPVPAVVPASPSTGGVAAVASPPAREGQAGRGGLLQLLRDNRTPGSLVWAVGWHAGHRGWRPSAAPAEVTAAPARTTRAA